MHGNKHFSIRSANYTRRCKIKYPHNMNQRMNKCNCQFLLYTGVLAGGILGGLFLVFVCWCISFCICMRVSTCPLHKIYYKRTIPKETPPMQEQTQAEENQAEQNQAEETMF